ncbi:von Willebrand factor type A domain-containing protein [Nannocystis exedens]|uniref:von Willebrand factor type A domain-containing protein n=1 Tax=Nannocystis exedens TaxID=54 RepID=A0A1I2IKD5_9BACT|nr:vWA domain-containing protein [Nannocystis exedens]PCC72541.1 von Willebrand factor type A domain protein [Nannocystis exedens]SFF42078.1 von Willebrand factor type A domain-containing protein [Nannocystis exedens]
MRHRPMEVLAASAIAVCCLALAIHPTLRSPAEVVPAPEVASAPLAVATPAQTPAAARPRIDVVFVLDTTGSMSGLIEGAKQKIWAIANRLASGEPRPDLRIGLVAYRDLGDEYVTKRFDFSADMDAVYAELLGYEVGGGGDHPEHVGRGLEDALDRMQWSAGDKVLKLVFLVGDAPPHDDYQDSPTTAELARLAAQRGILINTVQCGASPEAEAAWRAIAGATRGEYSQIAQNGGVVAVSTPFDDRLQALNNELSATVLTWGSRGDKLSAQVKLGNRMAMSASAAAEAASYSAKVERMNSEDLIGALDGGQALADIPTDRLPDVMQAMTPAQQAAHVADMRHKRSAVNEQIRELSAQRDAYLRDAERAAGAGDGFDATVTDTLRRQAGAIGVAY